MEQIATAESSAAIHDRSMANNIAAGDVSAFDCLMRRYNRRLYRLARATLRDRTEAEDALQDAYLSAFRSMASFRGDASLGAWLSRLVFNECFARMRRNVLRENVIPMVSASRHVESTQMIVDQSVFVLRSIEALSVDETAETLSILEETVRSPCQKPAARILGARIGPCRARSLRVRRRSLRTGCGVSVAAHLKRCIRQAPCRRPTVFSYVRYRTKRLESVLPR
jgi:DNA-directed RNA polymerase specialized sigma24 family protein